MSRVFLLSPAQAGGKRAALLRRSQAAFPLALRLQAGVASLGEVFAFCSGLYFRGKLAYAARYANPPVGVGGALVITPSRGLVPIDTLLGVAELSEFAEVPVDSGERRFTQPLNDAAQRLAIAEIDEVVLLGSIATGKYVDTLLPVLGDRLFFPEEFLGRGDMSRGALMLRAVAAGTELRYRRAAELVLSPRRRSARGATKST